MVGYALLRKLPELVPWSNGRSAVSIGAAFVKDLPPSVERTKRMECAAVESAGFANSRHAM